MGSKIAEREVLALLTRFLAVRATCVYAERAAALSAGGSLPAPTSKDAGIGAELQSGLRSP